MKSFFEKMKVTLKYGEKSESESLLSDDASIKQSGLLNSFAEISNLTNTSRSSFKKAFGSPVKHSRTPVRGMGTPSKKSLDRTPKSPKVRKAHQVKTSPKKEKVSSAPEAPVTSMFGCFSACFSDTRREVNMEKSTKNNKKNSFQDQASKHVIDPSDSLLDIDISGPKSSRREIAPPQELISYYLEPQTEANKGKKTLILDIDETLVHSSLEIVPHPDIVLKLVIDNVETVVYVKIRPGVTIFLQAMSKIYEVITFTASTKPYASEVIKNLDPEGKFFSGSLHREHCTFLDGVYTKNLAVIGRPMEDMILLDNSPLSFMLQPGNGLIIKNYYDDPSDLELLNMIPFLNFLTKLADVRPINENRMKYENNEEFLYSSRETKKLEVFNFSLRKQQLDSIASFSQSELSDLLKQDPLNLYYKRHIEGLIESKRTKVLSMMVSQGVSKDENMRFSSKKKSQQFLLNEDLKRVINHETSVKEFSVNELTNTTNKENETQSICNKDY